MLQGNRQKMPEMCGDTVSPCFLLAGSLVGNVPIVSPRLFGHFPRCIHFFVSVAEKDSNTLQAFPKESSMPFRYA